MAQKVSVSLEDDLDGSPAAETLRFSLGNTEFEIDLSEHNASAFRTLVRPFVEHARRSARANGQPHVVALVVSGQPTSELGLGSRA
jgi:hypothetical protein